MEYTHLSISERNLIQHFFNDEKLSISEISKKINRSKSTISRELKRNTFDHFYDADIASKKAFCRNIAKITLKIPHILSYEKRIYCDGEKVLFY